jgi:hypothetical protein
VRDGVRLALSDHALPRAAEVLHRHHAALPTGAGGGGACPPLVASCAAIVALVAVQSSAARAVVVLHADMLGPTLGALCASHQYELAQALLAAAAAFARGPALDAGA